MTTLRPSSQNHCRKRGKSDDWLLEPQRLRRVVLEHQVEFTIGEAAGPHCLRAGAHALQPAVLFGRTDPGPEFRKEGELRSDFADRVRASAFECIPVVELDECPKLRGFLH